MSDAGNGKVLDIKTADIKAAAPVFHEQGRKLSEALTKLIGTLDDLGEPWGKDEAVQQFATEYPRRQKDIEKATGTLVLGLVSIHEALVDMADGHVDNDALVAGMFTKAKPGDAGTKGGR
ncbi:hypothetical protein GCM10010315_23520 [Streptomyces luteosporeus]|uniref:WXG100 family type VII secretion target n=1 Tax=Streptomyces luteosporeus TaxID=173856 RepID=A0ABN3TQF1_9ACTN